VISFKYALLREKKASVEPVVSRVAGVFFDED